MTYSKNGIALAILGVEFLLSSLGVEFDEGSVAKVVEAVVLLVSFLLMVWNQVERPDTAWFIFKK